ncbi:site-specific integrase [Nakamurella endophytica]|uniref:Integrase n=1 Tax=Nakamurella endophytica TaxID=1748367 RepID=A0A917WJG7_9ACTN|nr:tyrosine-type recombinase/integrase [Nakamurella endophytica]GGM09624.1 integrase [Nakamurella endophytica]
MSTPRPATPPTELPAEVAVPDPMAIADQDKLSSDERRYIGAARAANTVRGYRSDWTEFTTWCAQQGLDPLPAAPRTVSGYLTLLAGHGAKVGTMSRRLSAIKFVHKLQNHPDPTANALVVGVWEGIRRHHTTDPDQARPLMPPQLWDVLATFPTQRTWKTPSRPPESDLAGARNRAMLLVGFVAALRRSEIVGIDVEHIADHDRGIVVQLSRSKTNQRGDTTELVVLPRATNTARCPVTALQTWLQLAAITDGPVFRAVSKGNRALNRRLAPAAVNDIVQTAVAAAGIDQPEQYSAHSLRAGFVTYAHTRGATDHAIAHQTRHRSLTSVGTYIRTDTAWDDNAATQLGL